MKVTKVTLTAIDLHVEDATAIGDVSPVKFVANAIFRGQALLADGRSLLDFQSYATHTEREELLSLLRRVERRIEMQENP